MLKGSKFTTENVVWIRIKFPRLSRSKQGNDLVKSEKFSNNMFHSGKQEIRRMYLVNPRYQITAVHKIYNIRRRTKNEFCELVLSWVAWGGKDFTLCTLSAKFGVSSMEKRIRRKKLFLRNPLNAIKWLKAVMNTATNTDRQNYTAHTAEHCYEYGQAELHGTYCRTLIRIRTGRNTRHILQNTATHTDRRNYTAHTAEHCYEYGQTEIHGTYCRTLLRIQTDRTTRRILQNTATNTDRQNYTAHTAEHCY